MIAHDFLFLNWFFTIVFRAVGKKKKYESLYFFSPAAMAEKVSSPYLFFVWLVGCFFLLFVLFFLYHMTASATVGKQKQYFHVQTKKSDIEGHKRTGVY